MLARASDDQGRVLMTVSQLCRRTGFGRAKMLEATQALVRAGLLGRHVSLYWWELERVHELAQQVRAADVATELPEQTGDEKPNSRCLFQGRVPARSARLYWLDAYREQRATSKRYRGSVLARPQEPKPEKWPLFFSFGEELARKGATSHPFVAEVVCSKFFLRDDPRLVAEGHPLCFMPGTFGALEPEVISELRRKARSQSVDEGPPPSQLRELDRAARELTIAGSRDLFEGVARRNAQLAAGAS
jgi:hypothetical protein